MILVFTGHRPDKLGGYDRCGLERPDVTSRIVNRITDELCVLKPESAIIGMAQGLDQLAGWACYEARVPFTAAVPFEGQESRWSGFAQESYRTLLRRAQHVHYVCGDGYAPWKMQKRNEWMVDRGTHLWALWDGSSGGTANCVAYARTKYSESNIFLRTPAEVLKGIL